MDKHRASEDLEFACSKSLRCADVARTHKISKHRVRTSQKLTGLSLIESTVKMLKDWLELCRSSKKLFAVHFHVGHDSAKAVCSSSVVVEGIDLEQAASSPHNILQKSRFMVIVFEDATVEIPILCTPTKLNGGDANALLDGLEFTPPDDRIVAILHEFEQLPCFCTVTWGIDGAYSNERLYAYSEQVAGAPAMHKLLCQNHRQHLIEVTAKACIGKPIVDTIFDTATLMRSGGFHLRFCGSVLTALRTTFVRWHAGRTPLSLRSHSFGEELKKFSVENCNFFKHGPQ